MLSFFRNNLAFSLTELLTTVGIVGTLSVIGIKTYQKQTNQAKTAEAKKTLSYIYTAERNFYNNWRGYHENLAAVGAVPTGVYNYDAGFSKSASLDSNYGDLASYPKVNGQNVIDVRPCTNFDQICKGDCLNTLATSVGSSHSHFFSTGGSYTAQANCQVLSAQKLGGSDPVSTHSKVSSAIADQNDFKAVATGQLKGIDIWSINEKGVVAHEEDGTQ